MTTKLGPAAQRIVDAVAAGTALRRQGRCTDGTGFARFFLLVDVGYTKVQYLPKQVMQRMMDQGLIQEGAKTGEGLASFLDRGAAPVTWELTPVGSAAVTQ